MAITVTVPLISDYPKLGDTHEVFRKKADIAWRDLANLVPPLNEFGGQANQLRDEVNNLRDEADGFKTDAAQSATNAAASEAAAASHESAAAQSAANAATSETNAKTSETNAAASEAAAATSETNAAASAATATQQAQIATDKAQYAGDKAADAESYKDTAVQKAAEAGQHEDNALRYRDLAQKWAENDYGAEVESGEYSAKHWSVEAQNNVLQVFAYKQAADDAANRAEAVVVPTDATYSLDALETALNGLLTQIVAQQAQISIMTGA